MPPVADPPDDAEHAAVAEHAEMPEPTAQPVVGRSEELARLDEVLLNAAAGQTSWVLLSGDAGTGRTRLAKEFASRAHDAGFAVAWARCGHEPACGTETPALSPAGQLLSALNPRLRLGASDEAVTTQRTDGTTDGTHELADLLSRRPTVCIIDDLHRASASFRRSLTLLATVLRDLPLVVLCIVQDEEDEPELAADLATLVRRGSAVTLDLKPLTVADVQRLLDRHAVRDAPRALTAANGHGRSPDTPRPDPDEAAELHRRSGGNPFVLTELLKLPPERRTGTHAEVPASVRRVLKARLAELADEVRALLDGVAVAGGRLDPELATHVGDNSRKELAALVDAAVTARLLVWEDGGVPGRTGAVLGPSCGRYQLPELARQVILHELTPSRRQALHAALAHALSGLPGRHDVRVARHLEAAGPLVPREDLTLAGLKAGHRCALAGRYSEARKWFQQAATMTRRPDLREEAVEAMRVCERRAVTRLRSAAG